MIHTKLEKKIWNSHQVSIFKYPSDEVKIINGREWRRDHVMMCPVCEYDFYGYQPVDHPFQPYVNLPLSECRQTCGHPKCLETELARHAKLSSNYTQTLSSFEERLNIQSQKITQPRQDELLHIFD